MEADTGAKDTEAKDMEAKDTVDTSQVMVIWIHSAMEFARRFWSGNSIKANTALSWTF